MGYPDPVQPYPDNQFRVEPRPSKKRKVDRGRIKVMTSLLGVAFIVASVLYTAWSCTMSDTAPAPSSPTTTSTPYVPEHMYPGKWS